VDNSAGIVATGVCTVGEVGIEISLAL